MTTDDLDDELARRFRDAVDPVLPREGVEQRLLQRFRGRLAASTRTGVPSRLRSRLGAGLLALAVVAIAGGILGVSLGLHGHPHMPAGGVKNGLVTPSPSATPANPYGKPSLTPSPTPNFVVPSTIASIEPASVSFPTALDGWALGDACDAQGSCEVGVARTTDGGTTWAMVLPTNENPNAVDLDIAAASSGDAWIWGTDGTGATIVMETHDGGMTWDTEGGGAPVVALSIAGGTAWKVVGCALSASTCTMSVSSEPVRGGTWTALSPLPTAMQGAAVQNSDLYGPRLVRSGSSAWLVSGDVLVRSDDGGQSWTVLSIPCAAEGTVSLGASSAQDLMIACANVGGWPAPQEVWTSSDGGSDWVLRSRTNETVLTPPFADVGSLETSGAPIGLAVLSSTTAIMLNDREDDLITHDGGVTWSPAALPASAGRSNAGGGEGLTFADALHGWTFNSAGLWATSDGGSTWQYQPIIGPVPAFGS